MHQEVVVDPHTGEERRKFGGAQPKAGAKKGQTLLDALEERIEQEGVQKNFVDALVRALEPEKGTSANLRGVKMILEFIQAQRKEQMEEAKMLEQLGRDELMSRLAASLEKAGIAVVKADIEVDAEEVTDADRDSGSGDDRPQLTQ